MSTATKTANKPQQRQQFAQQAESKGALTVPQAPRLPYPGTIASEKYGISEEVWQALTDAIFPTAKSVAGVLLAWSYCKWRKLDPFKRTVHIVPMWNSALKREVETVWPGISELRTTAFRTGQYAGCDECRFGPMMKKSFTDKVKKYRGSEEYYESETVDVEFPEWAQMTVYRMIEGQRVAFVGPKVRWLASYGKKGKTVIPNEMWSRRTDEQIEKCAEAAALRRAFPEEMGGDLSAEEMAGQHVVDMGGGMTVETPAAKAPKRSDFTQNAANAKDVDADGNTTSESEEQEPEGHELIDETGVVVQKIVDDDAFCDAVVALFEKATDLKALATITENNLAELDSLPKALGRRARDAYDVATERLKGAKPAKEDTKAKTDAPAAGLSLKNARGKAVEENLTPSTFAVSIDRLFRAAALKIDLEGLYRHNADAIRALDKPLQDSIVQAYDQAIVALGQS